jgi:hypothetical protein
LSKDGAQTFYRRLYSDMAMGRAMGPEQPDPQTTGPSRTSRPPETVPEEVRKLWDLLPRRERQRSRRRYFRAKIACTNRAALTHIDARILVLEATVAELRSIVAALASGSSARPDSNSAPDDEGLQPAPAPTADNPDIVPEDFRAQEPVLAVIIPDISSSISEAASSAPTSSPPKKKFRDMCGSKKRRAKREREAASAALPSERDSPANPTCARSLFGKRPPPWLRSPSGTVTGPSTSDPVTLPPTVHPSNIVTV